MAFMSKDGKPFSNKSGQRAHEARMSLKQHKPPAHEAGDDDKGEEPEHSVTIDKMADGSAKLSSSKAGDHMHPSTSAALEHAQQLFEDEGTPADTKSEATHEMQSNRRV